MIDHKKAGFSDIKEEYNYYSGEFTSFYPKKDESLTWKSNEDDIKFCESELFTFEGVRDVYREMV